MKLIKVGNPNRLVKVAIQDYLKTAIYTYIFNDKTGEIALLTEDTSDPRNWYFLNDDMYPLYENGKYIGYRLGVHDYIYKA